jgi:hypothetical protein
MYVFVDDSGDPGFKFGKGSSNFLVYSACTFLTAEEVSQISSDIQATKTTLGLNHKVELKFTKSKPALRNNFLAHIGGMDLASTSIVLDKRKIRPTSAINLQIMMLSELLYGSGLNLASAKVFLDGQGSRGLIHAIQRSLKNLEVGPVRSIREVKFADSAKNDLIQLADMIAGSIHRSFEKENSKHEDYLTRLLASKGTHTVRRLFGDESR